MSKSTLCICHRLNCPMKQPSEFRQSHPMIFRIMELPEGASPRPIDGVCMAAPEKTERPLSRSTDCSALYAVCDVIDAQYSFRQSASGWCIITKHEWSQHYLIINTNKSTMEFCYYAKHGNHFISPFQFRHIYSLRFWIQIEWYVDLNRFLL